MITNISSPMWSKDKKSIICEVKISDCDENLLFVATPDDCEAHGRDIYARCVAGEFGVIAEFKRTVADLDLLAASVRTERCRLLAASEWTDTLSAKNRLGDALYDEWQAYRQALRDITAQPGFPELIDWPDTPPNG